MADETPSSLARLPGAPVDRIVGPFARFMHVEASGGIVLLAATAVALGLANSPARDAFLAFWKTPLGFDFGGIGMRHSLSHWINDGLMAIFFFVIGLEVKRELVLGELRDPRRAALPIASAVGGMLAPAGIYLLLLRGQPGAQGWGIPMATDIAFVVGCMAALGSRVPHSFRVWLLSLAIADDIGAILVIAFGYTESIDLLALGFAGLGIVGVVGAAALGVRSVAFYMVLGGGVWLGFHESGIHGTIAGVILGLLTPARPWLSETTLAQVVERAGEFLAGGPSGGSRRAALRQVERAARETLSPLERLEVSLHPWVGFVIMPVFALANAGVPVRSEDLADPVATGVIAGLLLGKPIGVVALSALAVGVGLARLPEGVGWRMIAAGGLLAGIGFTMAIFIAGLALDPAQLDAAKVGVLLGSALAAVAGVLLLWSSLPKAPAQSPSSQP